MDLQRHRPLQETFGAPDPTPFTEVIRQLDEYFAAQRTDFDLPITFGGTPFQHTVCPTATRAVGLANGRSPIGISVPCHRVVGATGDLTGYGGGLKRKQHLLDFERHATVRLPSPPDQRYNG